MKLAEISLQKNIENNFQQMKKNHFQSEAKMASSENPMVKMVAETLAVHEQEVIVPAVLIV